MKENIILSHKDMEMNLNAWKAMDLEWIEETVGTRLKGMRKKVFVYWYYHSFTGQDMEGSHVRLLTNAFLFGDPRDRMTEEQAATFDRVLHDLCQEWFADMADLGKIDKRKMYTRQKFWE